MLQGQGVLLMVAYLVSCKSAKGKARKGTSTAELVPVCMLASVLQESHRALMTKDLMNSGLLRDRYVADLFERLQVSLRVPGAWCTLKLC